MPARLRPARPRRSGGAGSISAVKAHYGLGLAFEQLGEKDKAMKECEEFLRIWRDADFNSVEIADAKTLLGKIEGRVGKMTGQVSNCTTVHFIQQFT